MAAPTVLVQFALKFHQRVTATAANFIQEDYERLIEACRAAGIAVSGAELQVSDERTDVEIGGVA
jgi:hypothetical protein